MLATIAAEQSDGSSLASDRLLPVVVAALLGFVSAYLIERIKRRREPKKELSWDLEVDEPKLVYRATGADRLKMSYNGRQADKLVSIRYTVTNTGNVTVKNQYLRFAFPEHARILDSELNPRPKPEMSVSDVTGDDPAFNDCRYKIGHLEPREAVTFLFVADGGEWHNWKPEPHNEAGDVSYQHRGTTQERGDHHHVAVFLFLLAMFVTATMYSLLLALVAYLVNQLYLNDYTIFGIWLAIAIGTAALMTSAIPYAHRASRAIAAALVRLGNEPVRIETSGHSFVAFTPGGSVRGDLPTPRDDALDDNTGGQRASSTESATG